MNSSIGKGLASSNKPGSCTRQSSAVRGDRMVTRKEYTVLFSLLLCLCACLTGADTVDRASDGMCRLYDYISGFSLTQVTYNTYKVNGADCKGLSQPHVGQPTQCKHMSRTVNGDSYNWNQCPPGFFLQGNQHKEMICCKPSSHPYARRDCRDVEIKANSYEVQCPAGLFVARTRDKQCGSSVCTSAIECCPISDVTNYVKNLDDVKARVVDDTQVPLSLLAHFLGFAWCGGCDGRYVGESMDKSGDKWISSTSGSCHGPKKDERLSISYSDFKLVPSIQTFSDVTYSNLKPHIVLTGEFINNDTHSNTFTVGQEIYRAHTISHTKMTSFTLSHNTEFQVSYDSSFFGGAEFSVSYSFGYETTEEEVKGTEDSSGSTLTYGSEITLGPCSAVEYRIFLASMKATQYYNATIDVSYSAEIEGFLRYGGGKSGWNTNYHHEYRGSGARRSLKYPFGTSQKSLYDDIEEQNRDDRRPWEWKNMRDRYKYAPLLLDILTDPSRHRFNLTGRFEEVAGHTASIIFQWKPSPAGCKKPERDERSVNPGLAEPSQDILTPGSAVYQTTVSPDSEMTTAGPDSQKTTFTPTTEESTTTTSTKKTTTIPTTEKTTTTSTTKRTTTTPESSKTTTSTGSQGTTEQPEMDFQETFVRSIDLETGSFIDVADIDTSEITDSGNDPQEQSDEEKILYFLPNGNRNPNFDFSKYFVALEGDKLMSGCSAVQCHLCLIILCVVGAVCGRWVDAL